MSMQLPANTRILEGVMTTLDLGGRVNIAPMGPLVDGAMTAVVLRPFTSSTTYRNLKATGQGVFHVTDDALLIARAAVGRVDDVPTRVATQVRGLILSGACRYYELEVTSLDDSQARTRIEAKVVGHERLRDFFGFNRAKHAVLEAAILTTRVHLTGKAAVFEQLTLLQDAVDKTGGDDEHAAMRLLNEYVKRYDD